MIYLNDKFRLFWNFVILFAITYIAIEVPFRIIVSHTPPKMILIADYIITFLFLLDIVFNCFFKILKEGKWITQPKIITSMYFKDWFFFDLIAAIPFDLILIFLFPHIASQTLLLEFIRLTRMAKLPKLLFYRNRFEYSLRINVSIVRLLFFLYFIGILAHWVSCGWYFLTVLPGDNNNISNYIKSLYWCITTLATVGYGDITPSNDIQRIYAMAVMIAGAGVYGYVIGNIANIISNLDVTKVIHQKKIETINSFMLSHNFPHNLQKKVKDYFSYLWDSRHGYDYTSILTELPRSFQMEFSLFLNRDIFQKVPMFRNAKEELIQEMVMHLDPCIFLPGDIIFKFGEFGDKMYFLKKGAVEVVAANGIDIYTTLSDGSFFGETALLMSTPRNATIRAIDYCESYSLDKKSFDRVLQHYPEFEKEIKEKANKRMAAQKLKDSEDN